MNRLAISRRVAIVAAMVEGTSIISIVRNSPAKCNGCDMKAAMGQPDHEHVSTSYVEFQNLTVRVSMRRFTRLTNGFGKKIDNHGQAVALHFMYYKFVRVHKTLRVTPAMEAGIADHVWSFEEMVAPLDVKAGHACSAAKTKECCPMVGISGNIALNNVTDKDMELIWSYKAKHGDSFGFLPNVIQVQTLPNRSFVYNNVQFNYAGLHALNLITEVVNELHKKEGELKAAGQ